MEPSSLLRPLNLSLDQHRDVFDSDEETAAGSSIGTPYLEKEAFLLPSPVIIEHASFNSKRLLKLCNSSNLVTLSRSIGLFLLPSFISSRIARISPKPEKTNGISALDGLRGLACLFVFNEHFSYNYSDTFLFGYGFDGRRTVVQWPFIRILWSGFSMVDIFFAISGYVLSYKPLQQMRRKDLAGFQQTLSSSVLRRALRLYLPTIIAVLITGFLAYLGVFTYATHVYTFNDNWLHLHEAPPPIFDNLFEQMHDALSKALQMLSIWHWSDSVSAGAYDLHTWTIVVEFRSSMVLFLILIGVSRLRQNFRLLVVGLIILFCLVTQRRDVLLFTSGMFIAEIDMIRKAKETDIPLLTPNISIQSPAPEKKSSTSFFWLVIFILGLYLCSVATVGCSETPGFITLSWLASFLFECPEIPIRALGAVLITWATANNHASPLLANLFTNRFTTYLGKISYALYLVHGNVLKSLLYSALPKIYNMTGTGVREGQTMTSFVMAWFLGVALILPITLWLADIFWRVVDVPCVKFARWVEVKMCDDIEVELNGGNGLGIRSGKIGLS